MVAGSLGLSQGGSFNKIAWTGEAVLIRLPRLVRQF